MKIIEHTVNCHHRLLFYTFLQYFTIALHLKTKNNKL